MKCQICKKNNAIDWLAVGLMPKSDEEVKICPVCLAAILDESQVQIPQDEDGDV